MIASVSLAIIAIAIATFLWIHTRFKQVYYWESESGNSIKGTGFMMFKPSYIAMTDERLKQFGMYLLRFLPGPPKLIITDPEVAVKFMSKQHKYHRMKDFRLGSVFNRLFGEAIGTASGETHKRIRSVFDSCYSAASVAQNIDMMEEECKLCLQNIVEEKKGLLTMDNMTQLTFRILMKFTYGREVAEAEMLELHELRKLVETLTGDTFTNPFVNYPFYTYMPTRTNGTLAEFESRWLKFNKRFEKRFAEGELKDSSSVFYKIQHFLSKHPDSLSQDEFHQTLEEGSLANVDITCGATAWLLFHVALHQQVQKELNIEITNNTEIQDIGQVNSNVINRIDFLGKVVKESARKRPVMLVSTPEYVTCPMVIGDFHSPPRIEVSVDNAAVNSDKGVWGDPEIFNPRRFDDETTIMRKSLCRFGIGPRRCMGYRVADCFMKVLLVTLLRNYSLTLHTDVTGDDDSVPVQHFGPFCYPCVTLKLVRCDN